MLPNRIDRGCPMGSMPLNSEAFDRVESLVANSVSCGIRPRKLQYSSTSCRTKPTSSLQVHAANIREPGQELLRHELHKVIKDSWQIPVRPWNILDTPGLCYETGLGFQGRITEDPSLDSGSFPSVSTFSYPQHNHERCSLSGAK